MKFFLDANIPYSIKKLFRKQDKAIHVRDIQMADASDDKILERASKEGAILVTRDLEFANILLYPIGTHSGVMVLRVPPYFTAENINKTLKAFLKTIDRKLLKNAVVIVEPGQYRIRHQENGSC